MKSVEVQISVSDSDHNPQSEAQTYTITANAPWLIAGRIISAIESVLETEGCKLNIEGEKLFWQERQENIRS